MEDIPTQNTGVIEGSGTSNLYASGTIPYEVRNESGDWRPYVPTGEKQWSKFADFMACVSFSFTNDLETQGKFLTGSEPNFSDRFLAKMSGTTHDGNYLDKVADTARKIGLVKEEEWATVGDPTWEEYYSTIPQDVVDKAVKQDILYEEVGHDKASLLYHLKQSPLQITIPDPHPNHAVLLVFIDGDTAYYFDSYSPYIKTIAVSKIAYSLKVILKNMTNAYVIKRGGEYAVVQPATSEDGLITLLRSHGLPTPLKPDGHLDFVEVDKLVQAHI